MNEDDAHDQALMDLAVRTLLAFTTREVDRINELLDEWEQFTVHDLLSALMFISSNMRRVAGLDKREGVAELHTFGVGIDDTSLGVRTGARLMTAGLNGDVLAMRDIIESFVELVPDEELMLHAMDMFRCVFSIAAQGCIAAFEQDQRKQAETN